MAAKVHTKSYFPGHYSMRDCNEDSSSSGWSLFHGDKDIRNGQCYNGFPRNLTDGYPPHYDKDSLKQKMLEHEKVFKNQVYELHRLYRIQRNMMEEANHTKRPMRASTEASSSSNIRQGSQVPSGDAWKCHSTAGFPLLNSGYGTASDSPISCTKGTVRSLYQNGSTSKDSGGALDSRPFKVRKKLFNLQLPAEDHIDTEESKKLHEHKVSGVLSYAPIRNSENEPESSVKLSSGDFASSKTDFRIDASASASCVRNSVGLADLNKPFQIQEATAPSHVGFLRHMPINREMIGTYKPAKSNPGHYGFLKNPSIGNEADEREHLLNNFEAGFGKSNLNTSVPRNFEQHKLYVHSQTVQGMVNPFHHPFGTLPSGFSMEEPWRERGLEFSDRNRDCSSNHKLEPSFSSSHFASSLAQSNSSWPKPTSSFAQNMNVLEPFGKTYQVNAIYHGSASRLSSTGIDSLNCSRIDSIVPSDPSIGHVFGNYQKDDSKTTTGINLNEAFIPQDLKVVDGTDMTDNHASILPWLRPNRRAHDNGDAVSTRRSELLVDLNCRQASSSDWENVTTKDIEENQSCEKVLLDLNNEQFSCASTSVGNDCLHEEQKLKKCVIDINIEYEPDEEIEPTVEKENKIFIDLNSCISDREDSLPPSNESKKAARVEIDLEAPALLGSEDDVPSKEIENRIDRTQDDVLHNAAEIIFAISSYCPEIQNEDISSFPPEMESLLWFVDVVSTFENATSHRNEIDEFELMTLQIEEIKEGEYMPIPFVPEFLKEERNTTTTIRPRRGQSRRGRQRKDFQRDILPGMVSLARHEVTEDLQIFGELMRATGHSWDSGLTRRNGRGRGRRRAMVERETVIPTTSDSVMPPQVDVIEEAGCLEDRKSLTGWGKTTRRPRRQRYPPPGNPPPVVLT